MNKQTETQIAELQMVEQSLQRFLTQKQQFQTQIAEVENALKELKGAKESHRIIGNIMVKVDKKVLVEELNSKKEMLDLRLKSIEKQEKSMRESADSIQKEMMVQLEKKK